MSSLWPLLPMALLMVGLALALRAGIAGAIGLLSAPALLLLGAGLVCADSACHSPAFDIAGMALAAQGQGPLADVFFRVLTWAGSIVVLGPLAIGLAIHAWQRQPGSPKPARPQALFVPVALAGAALMAYATKLAIARPRPEVAALIEMPADASYPSAHALQISAFVAAWLLAPGRSTGPPRLAPIALAMLLVVLVAWSRLHLQVHYPGDILFALAAGAVWVVTLRQLPGWRASS